MQEATAKHTKAKASLDDVRQRLDKIRQELETVQRKAAETVSSSEGAGVEDFEHWLEVTHPTVASKAKNLEEGKKEAYVAAFKAEHDEFLQSRRPKPPKPADGNLSPNHSGVPNQQRSEGGAEIDPQHMVNAMCTAIYQQLAKDADMLPAAGRGEWQAVDMEKRTLFEASVAEIFKKQRSGPY